MESAFRQRGGRRRTGFTLLELLCVLCVIFVLAAMLFPVLGNAQNRARIVLCQGNLRQLGQAFSFYAMENAQFLPARLEGEDVYADGGRNWARYVYPYYRDVRLLDCPVSPDPAPSATREGLHLYDGNYGWNFTGTQGCLGPYPSLVRQPAEGYLLFDSGDPCFMDGGANWTNLLEELDLDFDSGLEGPNRHDGRVVVCFADLHADARELLMFLSMPNNRRTAPWYIQWQKKTQEMGTIPYPER